MDDSAIQGVLSIDKPAGLTSHDVVNNIRRLTGIRRVGHTGTLDPSATGLLIICIGRATRLAEYLTELKKEYVAHIRLGQETNTYDSEGEVREEKEVVVSELQLATALDHFRGEISQIPPMYSAVKVDGQPLYRWARQGQEIPRQARKVIIFKLDLLQWRSPDLQLRILCSSGTYVRSIAHDLGQELGCGAHLTELRRTAVGDHLVEAAVPLNQLNSDNWQDHLKPIDTAVEHLVRLVLSGEEALAVYHGQRIPLRAKVGESLVRAYDEDGQFIGVLTAGEHYWSARKILYQPGH